jgi:hypothetical protein
LLADTDTIKESKVLALRRFGSADTATRRSLPASLAVETGVPIAHILATGRRRKRWESDFSPRITFVDILPRLNAVKAVPADCQ